MDVLNQGLVGYLDGMVQGGSGYTGVPHGVKAPTKVQLIAMWYAYVSRITLYHAGHV